MQTDKHIQIEQLLDRFFEGETTQADEQQLYAFFARRDLPEHLLPYKPLFGYFETGLAREIAQSNTISTPRRNLLRVAQKYWWVAVCAAAVAMLLVLNVPDIRRTDTFDPYEGSYIIRNGVKITDRKVIEPMLEKSVRQCQLQQKQVEQLTCRINKQETWLSEKEQQIRSSYQAILDDIPNRQIRQEVQDILGFK